MGTVHRTAPQKKPGMDPFLKHYRLRPFPERSQSGFLPCPELTIGLVDNNAHGYGDVEASHRPPYGDSIGAAGVCLQEGRGEAYGLLPKDEIRSRCKTGFGVGLPTSRGEIEERTRAGLLEEVLEVSVMLDFDVGPVVKSCPAKATVVGAETQGVDEVQGGVSGPAQAADTARVGRDFGLYQDDVQAA